MQQLDFLLQKLCVVEGEARERMEVLRIGYGRFRRSGQIADGAPLSTANDERRTSKR
jgi:hypothetical protein